MQKIGFSGFNASKTERFSDKFILTKTGTKWDGLSVEGVSVEELDSESFEIFWRHAVSSKRMTREDVEVRNEELLDKLGLLAVILGNMAIHFLSMSFILGTSWSVSRHHTRHHG